MIIKNSLVTIHAKVVKAAVAYNLTIFALFMSAYLAIDFSKHFTSATPVTARGKVYYAMMVHTTMGSNDIVPKTDLARAVTALHATLTWVQLLLIVVS